LESSRTTKLLFALIAFFVEAALQVSGYTNRSVATLLLGIAGILFLLWVWDAIRAVRAWLVIRKSTAWAARDRLELFDIARLASNKPLDALFEEPQRSVHRRLKDAVDDGKLNISNMRGTAPNILSVVRREDLRAYAQACQDEELLAFLRRWDALNPPAMNLVLAD
jgi:hypothetical protein